MNSAKLLRAFKGIYISVLKWKKGNGSCRDLNLNPKNVSISGFCGIRTPDLLFQRPVTYPLGHGGKEAAMKKYCRDIKLYLFTY